MSIEAAKALLRRAEQVRRMPFQPKAGLEDYEQRNREIQELVIRAFVEAADEVAELVRRFAA